MTGPTPEAPPALPLKGATPTARHSRIRGVRLIVVVTGFQSSI
jgi:hypothetical protein